MIMAVPEFGILLSPADFYLNIAEELNIPIEASIISNVLGDHALKSDQIHPKAKEYHRIAKLCIT